MSAIVTQYVVPENIHTPSTEGISHKFLPPSSRNFHFWTLMALRMVLPTTQFLTEAVVFDSNLLVSKTEKSYILPQKVHSDDSFILFSMLKQCKLQVSSKS